MRWLWVGVLCACSGSVAVDAGVDAGQDAGLPCDACRPDQSCEVDRCVLKGAVAELRYLYRQNGAGSCIDAIRECSVTTPDDGGIEKWRAFYADAGCPIVEEPAQAETWRRVRIDCRGRCEYDGGHEISECCVFGHWTPYGSPTSCVWTPP